jgi:uncharacterized protein
MASTNQGPEYFASEKKYLAAQTSNEKIYWLEEMIRNFKKHKGSEKMQAELKKRLIKLKEKQEKVKKSGRGKKGLKKEGYQVVLVGKTNSGKSSILSKLTNARPKVSNFEFTTKYPEIGTMDFEGTKAQIIDLPSLTSKDFDYNIVNTADCLLIIVEDIEDIKEVEIVLDRTKGKKIIVINKFDKLDSNKKRKVEERCKANRFNFVLVSAKNNFGFNDLKRKIFESMKVVRIYTKEPHKQASKEPVVLPEGSNVKDVAESIYTGFSLKVKEARLTGPSGKFSNQKVSMNHILKDKDIVEFRS